MQAIYDALVGNDAVFVNGVNFYAVNYGEGYSESFNNGFRKVGIVADNINYLASVPEDIFPENVLFKKEISFVHLTEISDASNCTRGGIVSVTMGLDLKEAIKILKSCGMRFEE